METDGSNDPIESNLLRQFREMNTEDKDVLILQLRQLLNNQISNEGCAFYLDMTNWNIQAAVCAFYDFMQPPLPNMALIKDITLGEGEAITPATSFVKTWHICNNGNEKWPIGCYFAHSQGEKFSCETVVRLHPLEPNESHRVSLNLLSPPETGMYEGKFRTFSPNGLAFGEIIWVILSVESNGILGVTQGIDNIDSPKQVAKVPPNNGAVLNPFATPPRPRTNSDFLPNVGSVTPPLLQMPLSSTGTPLQNFDISPIKPDYDDCPQMADNDENMNK
ncbi:DgyrCDS9316 [Dimorphilus gyrociliatus]|uniref:DgyrCDS9316 n=1 Tax=Dimorphilus gyrociliatus TaxID=2664684 RepID=A0A7I8VY42_9ANNE|nr:DgyrCDS9316 [Dimorphilus gyrociliatus]